MLLEEALAALLRGAGFAIVSDPHGDPTLARTSSGVAVLGRGAQHQVDVIADFEFISPFSYPPRLLLEAKFQKRRTGLPVIRNAVGLLRDVSEWFLPGAVPSSNRYHYQVAVFSKTPFTRDAQLYAYAHDIVLVPLENNSLFQPIIEAISTLSQADVDKLREQVRLGEIREIVRSRLLGIGPHRRPYDYQEGKLALLQEAVAQVGVAFLARTSGGFPLFLIPDGPLAGYRMEDLEHGHPMRVHYNLKTGWRLELQNTETPIGFSFDLPEELFHVFSAGRHIDPERAMEMKSAQFDQINAFRRVDDRIETMVLRLDQPWIESVRNQLASGSGDEQR